MDNSTQQVPPLRSESSVDLFITKLDHRLPEIRARAAGSLASAVSLGLLPAAQLAARLRDRLQLPDWRGRQEALELLRQLQQAEGLELEVECLDGSPARGDDLWTARRASPERTRDKTSPDPPRQLAALPAGFDVSSAGDFADVRASTPVNGEEAQLAAGVRHLDDSHDLEPALPPPLQTREESDIVEQLPWQPLVPCDLAALSGLAEALRSGEGAAVRQALHQLHDVTLHDFPAEVFVQRPQVLQAMFHVLAVTAESETDVILSCLHCLTSLASQLLHRCDVIASPDTRQPGGLGESPGSEAGSGLPLPVFCGQLLSQAVSCLYVRHWAALQSAAALGEAACALARRCLPGELWTRHQAGDDAARAALLKALKVVSEVLRWHRQCYQGGDSARLHRAGWLMAASLLVDVWAALPSPPAGWARRHGVLAAPTQVLFDELLFTQQPALHGRLLALCADEGCAALWRRVARLRRSMEAARRLTDDLSEAATAAECAELHGGATLTERLVGIACSVVRRDPPASDTDTDADTEADASRLLLRLLTAAPAAVRAAAYRRAAAAARAALREPERSTVPALLQPRLLELALDEGLTDPQTATAAADLVVYAVTSESWVPALRPHLLSLLPLLLCHVTRPQLTRPINHVTALAGTEQLRGDLILTTHQSRACREDAWTRIISRLSAQNANAALLPDLSTLGALDLLEELSLLEEPPPVTCRRGLPNDVETLSALLPLAWCSSASLEVRRATLAQLAALLEDVDLHRAFLDHDGLPHLARLITRAVMREPDMTHDISLLPDCVTLLRHLALLSPGCRQHLAGDAQLQLLLVRVLLMFRLDGRVRAAAVQLLLAVSLDQCLTCRRSQSLVCQLSVPQVMAQTLRLPFLVEPDKRRQLGRDGEELPTSALTDPVTVSGERVHLTGLLRSAWALAWHGSLGPQPAQQQYSDQLRLPDWQLAAAGAGQLQLTAAETLQQLEGVTSHTAARVLLAQLGCYTRLYRHQQPDRALAEGVFAEAAADRWLTVLKRHLLASPTTEPDRRVLVATLELLLQLPEHSPLLERALQLLSTHSQLLTETLARTLEEHRREHLRTALRALELLCELCQRPSAAAGRLLEAVAARAPAAAARQPLRCAALLQMALLSPHRLSSCLQPAVRLCRQLCRSLLPEGGLTESWDGSGALAAAALCLHAATLHQEEWTEEWALCWRAEVPDGGQLLWLGALWHHRHLQIRWGGVAATLGLARWPAGAAFVSKQLQHMPGGVWDSALSVLVCADEAAAVREQAALLLASLSSHLWPGQPAAIAAPEVAHADAGVCLTGVPALVTLLERADWCGQLCSLLSGLAADSTHQNRAATPSLAAAVLRLVHNVAVLSPADIVPRLPDVVHGLIQCAGSLSVSTTEGAACWSEVLRLCATAAQLEGTTAGVRHLLLCDGRLLDAAAAAAVSDAGLRAGLFRLLEALLSVDLEPAFSSAAELLRRWPALAAALPTAPQLLEALLAEEAARTLQLVADRPRLAGLEEAGGPLCAALLPPGAAGRRCLPALLLVSPAAKQEALQQRLHARLANQLRLRIAELVTGSLGVRAAMSKTKERALLAVVLADLDLLRNLMSGSAEAKVALASAGLPDLLHKLWPWCVTSRRLAVAVLCTLNTLAAGCVDGARRLAYTSAALHQPPSASPSASSLVHAVLEDCRRHLAGRAAAAAAGVVQRLAVSFSLLAAAALVPEGRSIICRSTFLSQFRFGRGGRPAPGHQQRRHISVTRLWLLLIKNVTFFEEGQKVVARIPEVTGSLVTLMSQEDTSLRSSAVLVLRNLSYLTAMQTALINTDGFVAGVAGALRSGHPVACCAAVALCWQLLTNSRKARAVLTSTGHLEKLKSAVDTLDGVSDEETANVLVRVKELLRQETIAPTAV